jgi:hypothetical protein
MKPRCRILMLGITNVIQIADAVMIFLDFDMAMSKAIRPSPHWPAE